LFVEVIDALMLYHHFHMAIELLDLVMEIPANNKPFFWIKKGIVCRANFFFFCTPSSWFYQNTVHARVVAV
jgi:hypothetical protein